MSTSLKTTVTYEVTDSTQTTYNFPFMYLKAAFIKAAATASDGTYTTLTYSVDYTIADFNLTLASPLPVGTLLTISRETDTAQLVGWVDNSILRAYDMNKADIQTLHILEELQDYVMLHGMVLDTTDNCWEAFGKRIKNVAMPLNEDDAVTVRYIEDIKTNFISTVQKVCNDAMTALRNLCDETMAAIRNAVTQCTAKAAIATEAAKTTTAAAGRIAPVLKRSRKQCWLLCKLPKTSYALVHYKILGAQYYDQYSTLEVIIKNGFGWCEYKGRSTSYQVHVKAYETENSIDVYLYAQNYDDIWEVFLVKNNAVSEFSYKHMGDETYKPEGTLKCDTVTGLGMSGVNLFCGKQIAYIEDIYTLKRSKTYAIGDIAYSKNLPSWARLECVRAGTTSAVEPDFSQVSAGGALIDDGSVCFIIEDMRDGTPVGCITGRLYLPAGYVKANGATVQRADYPRLVTLADKYNLWTEDSTNYTGLFGVGNGSTTMVLPDWRGVIERYLDDGKGYDAGRELGSYQTDQIQNHTHYHPRATWVMHGGNEYGGHGVGYGAENDNTVISGSYGLETRPKNIAVLAVIRY